MQLEDNEIYKSNINEFENLFCFLLIIGFEKREIAIDNNDLLFLYSFKDTTIQLFFFENEVHIDYVTDYPSRKDNSTYKGKRDYFIKNPHSSQLTEFISILKIKFNKELRKSKINNLLGE